MRTRTLWRLWSATLTLLMTTLVLQGAQEPQSRPGAARDRAGDAPPAPGTARITGLVVVSGSTAPARNARVVLALADGGFRRESTTGADGAFAFTALPAGRYVLSASKPGHLGAAFGQSRPGRPGTPIQLTEGQRFAASLFLTRGGVLTGTVLDEHGDAVPGTQVRALRNDVRNGRRTLQPAGNGATDDRGVYRIFGLQPGDYVVLAVRRNERPRIDALRQLQGSRERFAGRGAMQPPGLERRIEAMQEQLGDAPDDEAATGYAPVYFPGTTVLAEANAITLGPGEERSGLDFQLQRVLVARIEGLTVNSTGTPLQSVQVTLVDLSAPFGHETGSARVDDQGRFTFSNVPPGQYRILANAVMGDTGTVRSGRGVAGRGGPGTPEAPRAWGALDITVDGRDLSNVAVSLIPGVSVAGRVVFHGAAAPPSDLSGIRISLAPDDSGSTGYRGAGARVDGAGRFSIPGIGPGRYRVAAGGVPRGWTLDSAVVDGQDALDFPFEIKAGQNAGTMIVTFTDRQAELRGQLTDSGGAAAMGYTLLLFPADARHWASGSRRIRTAQPATDGTFSFRNLPPGDYKITPLTDAEPGAWLDPAFLQQLDATAMRVTIGEGEQKTQNIRLSGG